MKEDQETSPEQNDPSFWEITDRHAGTPEYLDYGTCTSLASQEAHKRGFAKAYVTEEKPNSMRFVFKGELETPEEG